MNRNKPINMPNIFVCRTTMHTFSMSPTRSLYAFLRIFLLVHLTRQETLTKPCPDVPKLDILPGVGWDALTNRDTKQLTQLTYEQCKLTPDGKFMIPDNTIPVSLIYEKPRVVATVFDHWSNYTPPTASFFIRQSEDSSLLYSFSDEYQEMKSLQVQHDAFTCRSQLRRLFYRIHATFDASMTHSLKQRFREVIRALNQNYVENAKYLIEMIVGEYGTHYTKSVDVGEVFVKEDYLRRVFLNVNNGQRGKIISASKLSLLDYTSFSWKDKQDLDSSLLNEYNDAMLHNKIRVFGRSNWDSDANFENMMAIDKSGDLLTGLLTDSNFPNVSTSLLNKIKKMLDVAIHFYFYMNIHRGCTQPKSTNFDYLANFNDGTCVPATSSLVFGGVFEMCEQIIVYNNYETVCTADFITNNLLTGSTSCPTNCQASTVHSRYTQFGSYNYRNVSLISCIANSSLGSSFMFGGLYSSSVANIFTKSQSCPASYAAVSVLDKSLSICVNNSDNETAKHYALPFGGFAMCSNEFRCPIGHKKHLAVNFENTNMYYCLLEANLTNFGVVSLLNRPPFGNFTVMPYDDEYDEYGVRVSPDFTQSYSPGLKPEYFLFSINLMLYYVTK